MRIGAKTLRRAICAALLASGVGQVAAAAEPGFYIGVAAGQTDFDVSPSDGILVSVGSPLGGSGGVFTVLPESTTVQDDEVSWSAIVGYRIHTYVAAELAYMSLGEADVTEVYRVRPFGPLSPGFTITDRSRVTVKGPAISLLGILPFGAGWEAYLRGGVLFADYEYESIAPPGREDMTFGSEEWLAGVGIQWTFARRWGLRLEYQRTDTIERNLRSGEIDLDQISLTGTFAL